MFPQEKALRRHIVETGRLVYQKGWVAANDGNLSARFADDRLLVTPTGVSKGMLCEDELVVTDLEGRKICGEREPTTEIGMHLAIYRLRPDIGAVVHAHPPVATGFAAAGRSLNLAVLPEVVVQLGTVPVAAFGLPGTPALSEALKPHIPHHEAVLMANHGAVCYGESLEKAFSRMDTLEHAARISLVAELLGGPKVLPRREVQELLSSRESYSGNGRAARDAAELLAAEDLLEKTRDQKISLTRAELVDLIDQAVQAGIAAAAK